MKKIQTRVSSSTAIKAIILAAAILELAMIAVYTVTPTVRLYRSNILHDEYAGYVSFESPVDYGTLFFEPDSLTDEFYTLGFTSQKSARESEGKSLATTLRTFDEETVVRFNETMKKCTFKSVDKAHATFLTLFVSKYTNLAYTEQTRPYIMPEMSEFTDYEGWFEPKVLDYVSSRKFGVYAANVSRIFGRTYLFALFDTDTETQTLESGKEYTVLSGENMKWGVFEIAPDEAGQELALGRSDYRFYSSKGSLRVIDYFNPADLKMVYAWLGIFVVTVLVSIILKRKGSQKGAK